MQCHYLREWVRVEVLAVPRQPDGAETAPFGASPGLPHRPLGASHLFLFNLIRPPTHRPRLLRNQYPHTRTVFISYCIGFG